MQINAIFFCNVLKIKYLCKEFGLLCPFLSWLQEEERALHIIYIGNEKETI